MAVQAACAGRARLKAGGAGHAWSAHLKHLLHVRDLGRVKAERLVERRRALPSRKADVQCEKKYGVRALGGSDAKAACTGRDRLKAVGVRARAEHREHKIHVCDAGSVPIGNVRVEILQVVEEVRHVGDGRDVPVGDGAVRCNGGSRVGVVRLERRLQAGRVREGSGLQRSWLHRWRGRRWRRWWRRDKPARAPLPS